MNCIQLNNLEKHLLSYYNEHGSLIKCKSKAFFNL